MSRPTVTELLQNLKEQDKEKKQNNITLTESESISLQDTITEVHSVEESNHQDIYDQLEQLAEKVEKLEKKIQKLETKNSQEKFYKERIEYVEQNKVYNDFFDIPVEQRTYKPVIKKEEIKPNCFETRKSIKRNPSIRKRSQSKKRKYK